MKTPPTHYDDDWYYDNPSAKLIRDYHAFKRALKDIAHCTNEAEVKAAILKHKDVFRECM